ncbi:hypothetical protein IKO50_06520 [bacterium]|nr:hypothetical protein [bacterium]
MKKEMTGAVEMTLESVNTKPQSRVFSKTYATVIASIVKQEQNSDNTKFTIGIDDNSYEITDFVVYYKDKAGATKTGGVA